VRAATIARVRLMCSKRRVDRAPRMFSAHRAMARSFDRSRSIAIDPIESIRTGS
jgi:hypothetical protein